MKGKFSSFLPKTPQVQKADKKRGKKKPQKGAQKVAEKVAPKKVEQKAVQEVPQEEVAPQEEEVGPQKEEVGPQPRKVVPRKVVQKRKVVKTRELKLNYRNVVSRAYHAAYFEAQRDGLSPKACADKGKVAYHAAGELWKKGEDLD